MNIKTLSLFAITLALGTSYVPAMEPEVKLSSENKIPSLNEILENLDNKTLPLKDRCVLYGPTKILNDITPSLKRAACKDLVFTGMFAVHFHIVMTGEIPHALDAFVEAADRCKDLNKQHKSVLQKLKQKKSLDINYYLEKGVVPLFFLQKDPSPKILTKIKAIEIEIRQAFPKKGDDKTPVFKSDQLLKSKGLLGLAVEFGSHGALYWCFTFGKNKLETQDYEGAASWLEKAAQKGHVEAMYHLASMHEQKGNLSTAKIWLEAATKQNHLPSIGALMNIATMQDDTDSLVKWSKIGAEAGIVEAMHNLAYFYYEKNDYANAIIWFEKARRNGAKDVNHFLACSYRNEGKKDLAIAAYKRAAKENIEPKSAMYNLASLYREMGDLDNAKIWYQEAGDDHAKALCNLGVILYEEKRYAEAESLFEQAAKLGDHEGIYNLATIFIRRNDYSQARPLFEKLAKLGHKGAMTNLATCFYMEGNMPETLYWSKKAIELGCVVAMNNLGMYHSKNGNAKEAMIWLQKSATHNFYFAFFYLGYLAQSEGDLETAKKNYQQAYNKGYNKALKKLAEIAEAEGDIDSAIKYCKEAIKLGVNDSEIYLAKLLMNKGLVAEAEEYQEFYEEHNESLEKSEETTGEAIEILSTPQTPEKVSTIIPKKLQRYLDRAEKREKQQLLKMSLLHNQENTYKTYKDVKVVVNATAKAEYEGEHAVKIQSLISALANGDTKRGRFEQLKSHDNLYSMRLTQGDRLVFEITEGNLKTGVTGIKIIAAKGHYKGI